MAGFLRSRQAGVQNDLSAGISPGMFTPEKGVRYGINSQISALAYDPVQSLLAIGTAQSQYGPPKIYVFGAQRVVRTFTPQYPSSTSSAITTPLAIRHLSFVANRLVSVDSRNQLAVWDLQSQLSDEFKPAAKTTYGRIACVMTDPGLDWVFVGLQQSGGEVFAYDLDRERPSPFRLPCFWRDKKTWGLGPNLVCLKLHPRDIGRMLIAYDKGAVIYSFKQNKVEREFEYVLPIGAPGGDGIGMDKERRPKLVQATWHPTGTFVLTAHEDGSLVFWDPKDGRVVAARSIYRTRVNQPSSKPIDPTPLVPFGQIKWCCKASNPDDTALLIAGGRSLSDPDKTALTFLDLGPTPIYSTSSWEVLSAHFDGKSVSLLPLPPAAEVADYVLIPRASPFYDGAQDPVAVLVLLTSGELLTLTFPSGFPVTPTNVLHPSLSFVHPFVVKVAVCSVPRERWLAMMETRNKGEPILQGGGAGPKRRAPRGAGAQRNVVLVAHADGVVRVWDAGFGVGNEEIENPWQVQVDVARAVGRGEDVRVVALGMSGATGEVAVGTSRGEVVVYRWGGNRLYGKEGEDEEVKAEPGRLMDVSSRAERGLREGLLPLVLYTPPSSPAAAAAGEATAVSCLSVSDVGFVAVGFESGAFALIDLRGPAVMLQVASLAELGVGGGKSEKRSSFILKGGSSSSSSSKKEFPTAAEFGVLTLEGDGYSSIACFVGTNLGHVATLKILPAGGAYKAQPVGVVKAGGDRVVAVCPVNSETGEPARATGEAVAGLREGRKVSGVVVVATQTEARIFKPPTAKGASRTLDDTRLCDAARVVQVPGILSNNRTALVTLFDDRTARAYALPSLKELGRVSLESVLDPARTTSAVLSPAGDLLAWTGPSELAVIPLWSTSSSSGGAGAASAGLPDELINPSLTLPPRPTISNFQWMTGTQYVSPTDLDLLIGGEDRPPSKRMLAAAAAEQRAQQQGPQGGGQVDEGWGSYLSRQLQERTERLNIVDDAMSKLQETSQGWADEVSRFVRKQKKEAALGAVKKSLF
ncbi:hypothetical protein VTJ04DRAFT_7130 [Mycothermus thermophilus]|uniref:uncharacterized protein n=1 Tax=Humicola insolens TaxID=85995 RepID=UPI003744A0F1